MRLGEQRQKYDELVSCDWKNSDQKGVIDLEADLLGKGVIDLEIDG